MLPMTRVTLALLIANIAIHVLKYFLGDSAFVSLKLWPPDNGGLPEALTFQPWQLVTHAFLHNGFTHLFFNMLALFMFGPAIEHAFGSKRFAIYYFVCVLGAAVLQLIVINGTPSSMVGASGGVFGLLLAFGMLFPRQKIMLLFPPIPMPAWLFVTLYGLLELVLGVTGAGPNIAHFAHLGGMVAGFILIQAWRRSQPRH